MQIRIIPPNYQIADFINQLWRFESEFGVMQQDSRLIVPNGSAKLIVPLSNSVVLKNKYLTVELREKTLYFFGVTDVSTEIFARDEKTVIIGVDINPKGVARIFPRPARNYTNRIMTINQLYPEAGEKWQTQFNHTVDLAHCIYFLQNLLYHSIDREEKKYYIYDHCINLINSANGTIGTNELVRKTGYTKRYLAMIFNEFLGLPPKTYASIIRFNKLYENWAKSKSINFYADFMYEYYFDQAHFIKEFKKYTGYSPLKFSEIGNEYGKLFYNDFPFLQSYG